MKKIHIKDVTVGVNELINEELKQRLLSGDIHNHIIEPKGVNEDDAHTYIMECRTLEGEFVEAFVYEAELNYLYDLSILMPNVDPSSLEFNRDKQETKVEKAINSIIRERSQEIADRLVRREFDKGNKEHLIIDEEEMEKNYTSEAQTAFDDDFDFYMDELYTMTNDMFSVVGQQIQDNSEAYVSNLQGLEATNDSLSSRLEAYKKLVDTFREQFTDAGNDIYLNMIDQALKGMED